MASQTIRSSSVTFLDTTDDRKLEVYIASTLPTTQIFNANNGTYTPDWNINHLILSADIFLDSIEVTSNTQTSIIWYEKIGTGTKTQISTGASLTISINKMSGDVSIITYICEAEYQGIKAQSQITFNRSDTGLNGTDGADGKSVTILGSYDTVDELQGAHPTGSEGDAYIVAGDLYVWDVDNSTWKNVGKIQGPQGKDGESAKAIILNADAQVFKINKSNVMSPSTITITAQTFNTEVQEWTYSINGGQNFLSTVPNGVVRNGNTVTITGESLSSNSIVIKASDLTYSDTYTVYKVFDGEDGSQGSKGDSAPIAFLTNENITFSADSQGQITATSITTNVVAYNGTTKVTPEIGTITDVPEGMTIIAESIVPETNEITLTITVDNNATLGSSSSNNGTISIPIRSPVITTLHLSWSKINTGLSGEKGTDAVVFQVYSENGYVLSKDTPSITLKTFAYNGDIPIEGGVDYIWYKIIDRKQTVIQTYTLATTYDENEKYYSDTNGTVADPQPTSESEVQSGTYYIYAGDATNSYLEISHSDVSFSCSYMCKMIFNENEYIGVVTVDDKNDTNTVFTSKPSSYMAGDIWIVGEDYAPKGVELGTVLRAEHTSDTYADSDWVLATKYDEQLQSLQEDVDKYNQYFSFDSQNGLRVSARDVDGNQSKFSTTLSNTQLAFNEGDEAIAYISGSKMHIKEAEVESPLSVVGQKDSDGNILQSPKINIGNFSIIVESNGSLSIVSNL